MASAELSQPAMTTSVGPRLRLPAANGFELKWVAPAVTRSNSNHGTAFSRRYTKDMETRFESSERVSAVARYVIAHPWEVFVERWNWKAAVLSAAFRGMAFALPMARLTGDGALRSVCIEIGFRMIVGGF